METTVEQPVDPDPPTATAAAAPPSAATRAAPLALAAAILLAMLAYLWLAGRIAWCACATPTLFVAAPASSHTSQHLLDWYSLSHALHGLIFYWALRLALPRLPILWSFTAALAIEAAWEMLENSPIIIDRYRTATAALGYEGDSIVNSLGDLLCCAAAFLLARRIGWRGSLAAFLAVELIMLAAIRDNLTLNVIMLLYPIQAIRTWQMGG